MIWPNLSPTLLGLKDLACTARTGVRVPVPAHDGLGVRPSQSIRPGPVTKVGRVAVTTEYLTFWTIVESRSIQSPTALGTAHTILVIGTRLGHYPLNLEHFPPAPDTCVLIRVVRLRLTFFSEIIFPSWTVIFSVANFAINLIIRTLNTVEIINLFFALQASKTFLMIQSSLGDHLLRLKDLPIAAGTSLPASVISGNDGGVPGHDVLTRPVYPLAADVAVDVVVRTNGRNVDTDWTIALGTRHALLMIQTALDLHLFSRENGSVTARTGGVRIVGEDLGGVGVD